MATELASPRYEVPDTLEAIEFCYQQGWTDGLPVVPPTPERVAEFLAVATLDPGTVLGEVADRGRAITAEKAAINAVMAGCLPAYFPVVVAAIQALTDDAFCLHGSMASTGGAAPLLIVNGPIRQQIDLNAGGNVFGPGRRANATIGRAIRLLLLNVCGAEPGVLDQSTLGHPGKYSYCIAENEEATGWEPLHVERGLARDTSAVTVMAAEAPHYVRNAFGQTPEDVLATVADVMAHGGYTQGAYLVVVAPEHRAVIERAGWSKADVRAYLAEHARRSAAELKRAGYLRGAVEPGDAQRFPPLVRESDLLIITAGGTGGTFSAVVPPWAGGRSSEPVTRAVAACADCAVPADSAAPTLGSEEGGAH
ncbi:MAG TPA: hypothetical protein VK066_19385 [Chloroflexota bacterium]|nr:hypothetical protein [Chloroflexota bacterium]